jgi:hypothetical protein
MKDMENRDTFSKYIYNLHNVINKMLHKNVNISYDDVKKQYEQYRAKCDVKNKTVKNKHVGCIVPLNSKHKRKCVIKIVPQNNKTETFQMDKKCLKTRG